MRSIMMILGLLFIALCRPSFAQSEATTTAAAELPAAAPAPLDDDHRIRYVYPLGGNIELSCKPADNADVSAGVFSWTVNGTAVKDGGRPELSEQGAVLAVKRGIEDDWGNYTCLVSGRVEREWFVRAQPVLRLPSDSNVVEGQKLKLTCRVLGRPPPPVAWSVKLNSAPESENATAVGAVLGDRVKLQPSPAGVQDGELVVEAAAAADAGIYYCHTASLIDGAAEPTAATVLRVKDMYAALWPFLGICAEVFILCAIILVYEKRRTKPELDDSDTDNHDQKKS